MTEPKRETTLGLWATHNAGRAHRFLLTVALATLARAAWALTVDDLPQLIALDDKPVAELAGPALEWSPDSAYLTVAGYSAAGEPLGVVAPVDGRPPLTIPNLASARLAIAPFGFRIACWQRAAPALSGEARFVLSIFDPILGLCAALPGVAPVASSPPIVWCADRRRIVTLRQLRNSTALVIYDPTAEQLVSLVATVAGLGTVLRPSSIPAAVIVGTVGETGEADYYLIDVTTGIASNVPPSEELSPPGTPQPAGLSPYSGLLAVCNEKGLWVSQPGSTESRQILPHGELGTLPFLVTSGPLWSPNEEHIAYALRAPTATASEVRIVTLGLEEIICDLFYAPADSPPPLGATVWVCMDLQLDDKGHVVEPKWATLKAQLSVTSSPQVTPQGQIVRARSVGLATGVLKRLTGLSEPPADMEDTRSLRMGPVGATPRTLLRSFSLPARQGLLAWSKGAATGSVLHVHVTRKSLQLRGSPAVD
ncbi:MAG: hypothetical protein ACUVX8_05850 [Candidatus Zipacnadales bacterium]